MVAAVGAVAVAEELACVGAGAAEGGGMGVVGRGRGEDGVGEEAVVEEGAFEEEVGQGVEEVPDVEDAVLGRGCAGWEEAEGGQVGG